MMERRSFIKLFTAAGASLIVPRDSFGLFQSQGDFVGAEDVPGFDIDLEWQTDPAPCRWLDDVEFLTDLPKAEENCAIVVTGAEKYSQEEQYKYRGPRRLREPWYSRAKWYKHSSHIYPIILFSFSGAWVPVMSAGRTGDDFIAGGFGKDFDGFDLTDLFSKEKDFKDRLKELDVKA
jgi:hypothetical protein